MTGKSKNKLKAAQESTPLPARPYEPTEADREAVWKHHERVKEKPPAPHFSVKKHEDGTTHITQAHPDKAVGEKILMEQVGTTSPYFLEGIIKQTLAAYTGNKTPPTENEVNFAISAIRGIEPRDEVEAMLATQMVAIHNATMRVAEHFTRVENLMQFEAQEKAYNKLARTFAAQVQALKTYRTGGEQKMVVQHVHVADGGQAVIGPVNTGGKGTKRKGGISS